MPHLRVRAFGGLTVAASRGGVLRIAASCRPIIGYLLVHRHRRVSRCELAEALWADREGEQARHCLSTALWRLKRSATTPLLRFHDGDDVSFNWNAPAWVDAVALELRLAPLLRLEPDALTRRQLHRLETGVQLYRGDYLIGMDHEWAYLERQRLRDLYCDGLYQLTRACAAAQDWSGVLTWGRRLSREEPLREDVYRMLMLAGVRTGNHAAALAQYRECERVLARDLGVAPMSETRMLYRQIARMPSRVESATHADGDSLAGIEHRLRQARRALELCQRELDQAADSLARLQRPGDTADRLH